MRQRAIRVGDIPVGAPLLDAPAPYQTAPSEAVASTLADAVYFRTSVSTPRQNDSSPWSSAASGRSGRIVIGVCEQELKPTGRDVRRKHGRFWGDEGMEHESRIPTALMLAAEADVIAPDGCEVRILAQTPRGSMAHFTLGPGQVSRAVAHRTVEELWYFLSGRGRMWRRRGEAEAIVEVAPGTSLAIPL